MIDCLIFSKNRAAQLDMLLQSIYRYASNWYENITVLFTAKDQHLQSYIHLKEIHRSVKFSLEKDFEKQTKDIIKGSSAPLFTFLVDDDVFFDFPGVSLIQVYELIAKKPNTFSLRLGENYKYLKNCAHFDNFLSINWRNQVKCAAYPLSVDGNIYDRKFIQGLLNRISFINPNKLESKLQKHKNKVALMYSVANQCLVGVPANRVSDTSRCSFGEQYYLDEDEACKQFLLGKQLRISYIDNINDTHKELKLEMS